ncbi:hypothetical protein CC79DRAFT_1129087 [Sarocladium strictum]
MAQERISSFYRIWFTWIDPLTLVPSVQMLLTDRAFFMDGLIPASMSVADPLHGFLFHGMAALYAFVGLMLAGTLRVTNEMAVWRMVVGGVLGIDVALMVSQYVSIEQQGRMSLERLRWQDWAAFGFTAGVAVIRTCFMAGIGVKPAAKGVKRA